MRYSLILISLLIFAFTSCSDGDGCYESVDTLMVTSLSVNGFKPINSLVIRGVNRNDAGDILANDPIPSLIKQNALPLSLSADSTGFVINVNQIIDTLYIRHTMILNFISENCGFAPNYIISGFRHTKGIDSVKITDSKVNPKSIEKETNDQNISIYFTAAAH
jgi:hypothetical protein